MSTDDRPVAARQEPPPAWQPLSGMPEGRFIVLERRGDPCSSNAAMVHLPQALIVIDPGSAPGQAELISRLAAGAIGGATLPVLIFLTHAHWDHFAALPLLTFPAQAMVRVLAHDRVTATLACDARQASQAFMFNAECPSIIVDVPLLPAAPAPTRALNTGAASAAAIRIVPEEVRLKTGRSVPSESIRVAGGEVARVFHAPGHSPDSLCIQVGGLLWVGDLLLAANPAVAGIRGWDGRALLASLQTVDGLLDALHLDLCCPGHGRCMTIPKTRQVLAGVQAQAAALGDVATLDPDRVSLLIECAEELLREGLALFTIIAGRLYTISYHLDALEESQTAKEVLQAMDIEGLDAALDELGRFAAQFRSQHRLETALPLKGIQTVSRIGDLFDTERLRGLIDPVLLRRAGRLLDDFVHTVRGIDPPATLGVQDVGPLLAGLEQSFGRRAPPAHDLWDASDDEQAFRRALTRRLAAEASAVRLAVDLEIASSRFAVTIDGSRIEDALHAILSEFAGAGVERVRIGAEATDGGVVRLGIRSVPDRRLPCFDPPALRFLDRGLRRGGGRLDDASTASATALVIQLEPAGP